ncbi:hypothetical protein SGPA1_20142 [Streptomyces misionensis JCM 4497]
MMRSPHLGIALPTRRNNDQEGRRRCGCHRWAGSRGRGPGRRRLRCPGCRGALPGRRLRQRHPGARARPGERVRQHDRRDRAPEPHLRQHLRQQLTPAPRGAIHPEGMSFASRRPRSARCVPRPTGLFQTAKAKRRQGGTHQCDKAPVKV